MKELTKDEKFDLEVNLSLMVMLLASFEAPSRNGKMETNAWTGHRYEAITELKEKGFIKFRSGKRLKITEKGEQEAEELLSRLCFEGS